MDNEQVLKREIAWETYMTAKLITSTGLQLLKRYDHKPENVRAALLDENGIAYVRIFIGILKDITKDDTVEYMLALVDELLSVNPKRARLFHDKALGAGDVYFPFMRLLNKKNWFIQEKSCKILTLILSARPSEEFKSNVSNGATQSSAQGANNLGDVLQSLVDWLVNQLRIPSHPTRAIPTAVSSLAAILREAEVKQMFVRASGVGLLIPLISPASTQQYIQLLYEATLCAWLLSFYNPGIDALSAARAIPRLTEVAKQSTKEKVVRVAVLTLKNLVAKGNFAAEMIDLGLPKIIQNLKLQAWSDEDLTQALDSLESTLKENIRKLNSFDKYKQEVFSGNLDWTPMHRDPSFWRENVKRFEDDDFQVLRVLVTLLENSRDPKTLAVACHDIAQFISNHSSGRGIVSDLKAKERVMVLMSNENKDVAKEALLCVQKILLSAKYVSYMQ